MIHKTGYPTLLIVFVFLALVIGISAAYLPASATWIVSILSLGFFIFILSFFRNPGREIPKKDNNLLYAPADGKIVVIEKIKEEEHFNDERLQVSIFMSPLNVHVNRAPTESTIKKVTHYKGKYLPAWNPKSSTENERCYTVMESKSGAVIMLKQIAGALARRIVTSVKVGDQLNQGDEYGFIKFGSRVDLILPIDTQVMVELDQVVKGNLDVIAKLK